MHPSCVFSLPEAYLRHVYIHNVMYTSRTAHQHTAIMYTTHCT